MTQGMLLPTENIRTIDTDSLVGMISAVTSMSPPTNEPLPDFMQGPIDRAVERISAAVGPGVAAASSRINRVYLAGPMTGFEDFNVPAFNTMAAQLRARSFVVENPAEHGVVEGADWSDYMVYDLIGREERALTEEMLAALQAARDLWGDYTFRPGTAAQ